MSAVVKLLQWRVLLGALLLLASFASYADDASCYAAGQQQVDKAMASCQDGWPFCKLDGFAFKHDAGNVWVAVIDYHYGNAPPGAPQRDTPTFVCNAGETPQPPDPCKSAKPRQGQIAVDGNQTMLGCDGQCSYALTDGTQTSNGLGQSLMVGTWTPTGAHCDTPTPGFDDGMPQPPRLCGGASCMDTGTGGVCANDKSGKSMCVDGPTATGPGGCSGTADGAICAGPKPPLPVPPQLSQITDPPTEITGSDHYTQQTTNPNSGGLPIVTPINVNTYGVGGRSDSPTSSGQTSGDKGPAPASSAGDKPGNTAAGGGDCGSPPAMTGDPALAMIARQQWLSRCGPDKADKNGNGQPDWTEVTDADSQRYGVTDTNPSSVFQEQQVGTDKLDQSSWAGNSCPDLGSVEVWGTDFRPDSDLLCQHLRVLRSIILLFAAIAAAKILSMGNR